MCVLKGNVTHRSQDYPVNVLLDSGADAQYVSAAFVRKAHLDIDTSRNDVQWVKVANGAYSQIPGEVSFTLFMGQYRSRIIARVLDLPDFEVILGLKWLREVNPDVDWKTLRVSVRGREGNLYDLPPAVTPGYIDSRPPVFQMEAEPFLTASQTRRIFANRILNPFS
jgi:Retroviral aspartyl protease